MAKFTGSITADGTVYLCDVVRPREYYNFMATIFVYGNTFGSGTVKIQASPDGGTTKIDVPDATGTAPSITANSMVNINLGVPNKNTDTIKLYAVMSGSTNPAVTVAVFDNRG